MRNSKNRAKTYFLFAATEITASRMKNNFSLPLTRLVCTCFARINIQRKEASLQALLMEGPLVYLSEQEHTFWKALVRGPCLPWSLIVSSPPHKSW